MLRTAANRLHGTPHVPAFRQQLPPRGHEAIGIDTSTLIDRLQRSVHRVIENERPDHVAVATNDRMRASELPRLVRIQRGVDPSEHDGCTSRSRLRADLVATQGVAGMDPDADDVSRLHVTASNDSRVSSVMRGRPYAAGVAAASTNSQRGVMTPTPKER